MQFFRTFQDWIAPALLWLVMGMLFWLVVTGLLSSVN
jgi:hypothetical protein